jgi:hypothetical protein
MWGKVRVKHLLTYYITAVKILTNDGLSSLIEVQQVKAEKGGECRQTAKENHPSSRKRSPRVDSIRYLTGVWSIISIPLYAR